MTNVAAAIVVVWILSIAAGVSIGAEKGRLFEGFVFRLCFGVIGLLVVALLERRWNRKCPYCRRFCS